MALIDQPILTIAIPTYNRSKYLDRALHYIYIQIEGFDSLIEIIVSDNCSDDDTASVVQKHIENGLLIRYIKNEINKGPDFNISQCFLQAKGKFVVAFGDDDIFNKGAIARILFVLKKYNDVGLFYMNWKVIDINNSLNGESSEIVIYDDYSSFYEKINQSITFISGIIVNSKYIKKVDFKEYMGSSLIQLPLYLEASFGAEFNIIHKEPLVGVQPENSGGYSFSNVFGENMDRIFEIYSTNVSRKIIFENIKIRLLMENFPVWIYRTRTQKVTYIDIPDIHKVLSLVYSKYYHYWLFVYPIIIMPKGILKSLWGIYRVYKYVLRGVLLGLKPISKRGVLVKFHIEKNI